jgi:hypothetical protein
MLVGLVAVGLVAYQAPDLELLELPGSYQERTEWGFEVGDEPALEISNFAGSITVRPGRTSSIQVVAIKKASSKRDLQRIRISASAPDGGGPVVIRTSKESSPGSASVEMELMVPADTRLDVDTGAGTVDVSGLTGPMDIHSGAGTVDLVEVAGRATIRLGAGNINYQGSPAGDCSFESGAGNINLRLPLVLNMEVDAGTGVGVVDVDYAVDGRVTKTSVKGTVGNGSQGTIFAHTGAGNVNLTR